MHSSTKSGGGDLSGPWQSKIQYLYSEGKEKTISGPVGAMFLSHVLRIRLFSQVDSLSWERVMSLELARHQRDTFSWILCGIEHNSERKVASQSVFLMPLIPLFVCDNVENFTSSSLLLLVHERLLLGV